MVVDCLVGLMLVSVCFLGWFGCCRFGVLSGGLCWVLVLLFIDAVLVCCLFGLVLDWCVELVFGGLL